MKKIVALCALMVAGSCLAKLPTLSDEAKAKADEAKAKTAWSDKVAAFQLCKAQDKVASRYLKEKAVADKAIVPMPACTDPGAYVPLAATTAPAVVAPVVANSTAITPKK